MSEAAKDGDDSRSGGFNGIVVALLVLVGVAGAGFMISALYSSPSAPPAPAKVVEAPREAPPAAAATPAAESSLRPGSTRYSLQLSPYSEVATADDVRAKIDKLGMSSSLRIEAHVQVGPFRTAEEAEAARAKLKELGVYGGQTVILKP
ncbi:MAG: SPOR domain-containing protein [Rhodocyclales bacterium]|nr:SPOR domain-containing protein [Rhodocyclales bacterium]